MKLLRTTCGFAFLAKPLGASGVARDVRNCPLRYQPWAFGRLSFSRCWLHFLTGNSGERSFLARRFEVATHPVGASRPQRKQPRSVKLLACSAASETQTSLRTHVCGALRSEHVGCTVTVCGWAHTIRDRGGVTFLLLRDRHGIVQVTIDAASPEALRTQVKTIRRESVVRVRGTVRARDPANVNASMPTGSVEIAAHVIEVLNRADPLPLVLDMERDRQYDNGPSGFWSAGDHGCLGRNPTAISVPGFAPSVPAVCSDPPSRGHHGCAACSR
jgi:hypothetical protein